MGELGAQARRRIEQTFSIEEIVRSYAHTYEEIVAATRERSVPGARRFANV
jgi:hypothetical protein